MKIYKQPRYKDFSDSNEEKDEESDNEPPERKEKRKIIKNETISVPISVRKRGRPRKVTPKILIKNKKKPQKKKQKEKENDNLEDDGNAIDSDYEFNKNPLIKENTNLDSFSDESDILIEENSLQHKNHHLGDTEEENNEDFNNDLDTQTQNIVSEDLGNRPQRNCPPLRRTYRP